MDLYLVKQKTILTLEELNNNKNKIMTAEVTVLKHKDVREKEQLYMKIKKGTKEYLMNIGKQTFQTIEDMSKEDSGKITEPAKTK